MGELTGNSKPDSDMPSVVDTAHVQPLYKKVKNHFENLKEKDLKRKQFQIISKQKRKRNQKKLKKSLRLKLPRPRIKSFQVENIKMYVYCI